MNFLRTASDDAFLFEIGERVAQARIEIGLTQTALSDKAGVGKRTIERLERGKSVQVVNLLRVLRELGMVERLNAVFPDQGPSPMELLKSRGKVRRRVSRKSATNPEPVSWRWEDRT